jgi:NAD dependent epimerase/dehydratase family enzyme
MTIVIAGGTGFLGRSLAAALAADGHDVYVLSRRAGIGVPAGVRLIVWNLDRDSPALAAVLHGADAVINLAGEPIAAGRWTAVRKRRIE